MPGLRRFSLETRFRIVAQPLFAVCVAVELAVVRTLDALHRGYTPAQQALVDDTLTILVKTFERRTVVARLVASIRQHYPGVRIIVVDDSRRPIELDGVQVVAMPFNTGISAGRNEGLAHVHTKYVLLADDDYIFWRNTDLPSALSYLERHDGVDIMGGDEVHLPLLKRTDYRSGFYRERNLWPTQARPTCPPGTTIDGLPVREKVPNFFIARTERLRLVGWDPALRLQEHTDFFTRAVGVLTTVSNPGLQCLHAQTPFDRDYMRFRNDVAASDAVVRTKYF